MENQASYQSKPKTNKEKANLALELKNLVKFLKSEDIKPCSNLAIEWIEEQEKELLESIE